MKISQYDRVMLKDGRTAAIVEVLEEDTAYIADVDLPGPDCDTVNIKQDDIERKLWYEYENNTRFRRKKSKNYRYW